MADWFSVGSGDVRFTTLLALGQVDDEGQACALPPARPIGALVVESSSPVAPDDEITYLASWMAIAALEGQMRVWRDLLPSHMRDQYDARAAEFERGARGTL